MCGRACCTAPYLSHVVVTVVEEGMSGTGGGGETAAAAAAEWIPLFEVASRDLDSEAPLLRGVLDAVRRIARCPGDGYKLDSEAQFAMGWWFYTVYAREEFVRGAVEYLHAGDPKAKDERALLELVRGMLRDANCASTIKLHGKRPLFARYWSWLMR